MITFKTTVAVALFGLLLLPAQFAHGQNDEKKVAERIDALIKVFAHPEAQADNLDETVREISDGTADDIRHDGPQVGVGEQIGAPRGEAGAQCRLGRRPDACAD